jgi:hypothetical protein
LILECISSSAIALTAIERVREISVSKLRHLPATILRSQSDQGARCREAC